MAENRSIDPVELREAWWLLAPEDRVQGFRLLSAADGEEFFFDLAPRDQADLLLQLTPAERRLWLRLLAPDDAADVIQETDEEEDRSSLLAVLDSATRKEVIALMAYEEDEAGGLMSSRFARVRADMSADEAISYLRKQAIRAQSVETLYYVYVLDAQQKLLGIATFRELFAAPGDQLVRDIMETDFISIHEEMDQEEVARIFAEQDVIAMPVVDDLGVMKGIVTVDDIVDVVEEEATEDIQKYGGVEALDEPYLRIDFTSLLRKRAGWLAILFVGELFTANALGHFQGEIDSITSLALFLPLIISSGGNSGSQASTLVIRAMTLGEVHLRDWWRIARREIATGLMLGAILGVIAILRVYVGHWMGIAPQDHLGQFLMAIPLSVVGVVLFGSLAGAMLPLALRRIGLDPASASAPLVATLVDVTGIIIYFTIASMIFDLSGPPVAKCPVEPGVNVTGTVSYTVDGTVG
jgi:magnesium transporter